MENHLMKLAHCHLYFIFACLLMACNTHDNSSPNSISIEIEGEIQADSIKMISFNNSEEIVAKEGHVYQFNFNAPINDAYTIVIFKNGSAFSKKIVLDGERLKMKAVLEAENFKIDTLIGSDIYNNSLDFYSRLDSLNGMEASDFNVNEFLLSSISNHLNHPFSFDISDYYLERNKNYKARLMRLKLILDQQPDDLKAHALSVHRSLNDLVKIEYLNLSDFKFYNRAGNVVQVDQSYKGDYLLDFWFVQCPPCVKDHKEIAKNFDLFETKNVELIGISIDTEADKWLDYLNTNQYNWQNYRELGGENDLIDAMNVWEFPTYLLVGRNGEIKTKFYSFEDLENYFGNL